MEDRKLQQDYLSRKFRKSPERLSMNQGDSYRPKQEQRQAIWMESLDLYEKRLLVAGCRLIVPYHHWTMGKDVRVWYTLVWMYYAKQRYACFVSDRVGSEFWSQSVPIGNAETGIK